MTTFQAIEIIEIPSGNSDNFDDIDNKIEAYQFLIDNGIIWKLHARFGRTALRLIDNGSCSCNIPIPVPSWLIIENY
mgnify:CR=1 FL=1